MTANIETLLGEVQARMNAIDSSSPKLTLPELRAAASMLEANGLAVDDAAFDNVLAGKLSAVDGQTELLDLLYLAKSLRPVKEKTESNPVGAVMPIGSLDDQVTTESGEVWLRSGLVEDDPSKFDSFAATADSLTLKGSIDLRLQHATATWRSIEVVGEFTYCVAHTKEVYKFNAAREFLGVVAVLADTANPGDLCFSPSQNKWYVVNLGSDAIEIYDADFNFLSIGIVEQAGESLTVTGVATDDTNLYVAISGSVDEIRKYDFSFVLLESQSYLTVDTNIGCIAYHDDHFYVFGNTADKIYKLTLSLGIVDSISVREAGGSAPGIAVTAAGIRLITALKSVTAYDLNLKGHHCLERPDASDWTRDMCEYDGHYYLVMTNNTVRKLSKDGALVQVYTIPSEVLTPYGIVINTKGVYILSNARYIYKLDHDFVYKSSVSLGNIPYNIPTHSLRQNEDGDFHISVPMANTTSPSMYVYSEAVTYKTTKGNSTVYQSIKGFDFYKSGMVFTGYQSSKYWIAFAKETVGNTRYAYAQVSGSGSNLNISPRSLLVIDNDTLMVMDASYKVPLILEVQSVAGLKSERVHAESQSKYFMRIK